MVRWYHCFRGHDPEQTLGDSEGQGGMWHAAVHGITKSDIATEVRE